MALMFCDRLRKTVFNWLVVVACFGCSDDAELPLLPIEVGECISDRFCGGQACLGDIDQTPSDLEPLKRICGALGSGSTVGEPCDDADDCRHQICLFSGTCSRPCEIDSDCASGQWCARVYARVDSVTSQSLRGCVPLLRLEESVVASVTTEELMVGSFVDSASGVGAPVGQLSLELDSVESGTQVMLRPVFHSPEVAFGGAESMDSAFGLRVVRLEDRASSISSLFDIDKISPTDAAPLMPVNPFDLARTPVFLLPSGLSKDLSDTGYTVSMEIESTESMLSEVTVEKTLLRRQELGGALDFNVFYVGGGDLVPEGTRGPEVLSDAFDDLDALFSLAGVHVGTIRQFEMLGGLRDRFAAIDRSDLCDASNCDLAEIYSELAEMFALSAGAEGPAINLFLVQFMEGLLGLSGGIPGALGIHGLGASGVAIAVDLLAAPGTGADLSFVLRHEVLHHLGLFHTSELNGAVYDALDDTRECRPERDVNFNGIMEAVECTGFGAENLMFWASGGTELSDEQIEILARSIVLKTP